MKVLIIGIGSIARKHIHVLRQIKPDIQIYALRSSKESEKVSDVIDLYDWDSLRNLNFHFAIVATPSAVHLDNIKALNELNIPMLVEKPLFINFEQIKEFNELTIKNPVIYVGCNMRFHPLIEFIKQFLQDKPEKINEVNVYCGSYLPEWRANKNYNEVYSSIKELGGGVHLDLIHEPDYIIYLFGWPVQTWNNRNKVSDLEINSYDASFSLYQYEGFNVQITLNYYRREAKRTLEIVRDKDTILVDFIKNEVRDLTKGKILYKPKEISMHTTYQKQMEYFLSCIKKGFVPMNSPNEAIEILKYVL